jgi:hypothetical protein
MTKDRVTPRIGPVEPSVYDGNTQPFVDVSSSNRYVTLKPIGTEPVRQFLGPDLEKITIEGDCTREEANRIDELEGEVEVRTSRWSGVATVESTTTTAQQKYKGSEDKWIYSYQIELKESP